LRSQCCGSIGGRIDFDDLVSENHKDAPSELRPTRPRGRLALPRGFSLTAEEPGYNRYRRFRFLPSTVSGIRLPTRCCRKSAHRNRVLPALPLPAEP
jgi:hypothetical protein